jgi:predicted acylesterase/phospholipase RssA
MEEEKIPIDFVAGSSAGAILGAAYCAGIGRSWRKWRAQLAFVISHA